MNFKVRTSQSTSTISNNDNNNTMHPSAFSNWSTYPHPDFLVSAIGNLLIDQHSTKMQSVMDMDY